MSQRGSQRSLRASPASVEPTNSAAAPASTRAATERSAGELASPTVLPRTLEQRVASLEQATASGFATVIAEVRTARTEIAATVHRAMTASEWERDVYPVIREAALAHKRHPSLAQLAADLDRRLPDFARSFGCTTAQFMARHKTKIRKHIRDVFAEWTRRTKEAVSKRLDFGKYPKTLSAEQIAAVKERYATRRRIRKLALKIFYPSGDSDDLTESDVDHVQYIISCWLAGRDVVIADSDRRAPTPDASSDESDQEEEEPVPADFDAPLREYLLRRPALPVRDGGQPPLTGEPGEPGPPPASGTRTPPTAPVTPTPASSSSSSSSSNEPPAARLPESPPPAAHPESSP